MIRIEGADFPSGCNGCGKMNPQGLEKILISSNGHQWSETRLCKECQETLIFLLGGYTHEMIRQEAGADE